MPRREGQTRDTVRHIAGNVGRDPERVPVGDDREIVSFSVAVTRTYPDRETRDDGETRWYSVSTGRDDLMGWVEENVHRGSLVVVEGFPHEKQSGDRTYHNFRAAHIGLLTWGGGAKATKRSADDTQGGDGDDW